MQNFIIRAIEDHNFTVFDYKTEVKTNPCRYATLLQKPKYNSVTLSGHAFHGYILKWALQNTNLQSEHCTGAATSSQLKYFLSH